MITETKKIQAFFIVHKYEPEDVGKGQRAVTVYEAYGFCLDLSEALAVAAARNDHARESNLQTTAVMVEERWLDVYMVDGQHDGGSQRPKPKAVKKKPAVARKRRR